MRQLNVDTPDIAILAVCVCKNMRIDTSKELAACRSNYGTVYLRKESHVV